MKPPAKAAGLVGEESIVQEFLAPLAAGYTGAHGLRDDCATITPPPGTDLVIKTDPVRAGVHFFADDSPDDIAWKALAVNVSDLAAKGATPLVYLAALSLPDPPTRAWMQSFAKGLKAAQTQFGCHLIGGDTDRAPGPLSIGITAIGTVPTGRMLRRGGARPSDIVFVSGTIGCSALGLRLRANAAETQAWKLTEKQRSGLVVRYLCPEPRLALGPALQAHATASMDVSDGLAKDFDRLCRASGVAGRIEIDAVPLSPGARAVVATDPSWLPRLVSAGDDYEILCTVPEVHAMAFQRAARKARVAVTPIGRITAGSGSAIVDADHKPIKFDRMGWDHF